MFTDTKGLVNYISEVIKGYENPKTLKVEQKEVDNYYEFDKLKIERNKKYLPENVGETGIVIEPIDRYKGRIFVSGLDWAAKTKSENTIEKGKEVIIEAVEGVTLIVSEKKN